MMEYICICNFIFDGTECLLEKFYWAGTKFVTINFDHPILIIKL
jgi:hypothetical protein